MPKSRSLVQANQTENGYIAWQATAISTKQNHTVVASRGLWRQHLASDLTTSFRLRRAVSNVTMSFGFSVGDFVAVYQLANKIRKELVDAPSQFKDISDESVTQGDN